MEQPSRKIKIVYVTIRGRRVRAEFEAADRFKSQIGETKEAKDVAIEIDMKIVKIIKAQKGW